MGLDLVLFGCGAPMPNRILRDGILTSPRVAKLNWAEETFYRRLHSVVDDFGRYYADHGLVRAACYPRLLNKVSDSDIEKWLTACVTAALVRVYPAEDGERYLMVLDFKQQVRATKSKFPQPPDICAADATQPQGMPPASAHLGVSVFGVEGVKTPAPSGAELFDEFWKAYPKKKSKDDALKAFTKRKPTRELLNLMLKALAWQCKTDAWLKEKGQFIPYPATWLNDGAWQDEPGATVGGVSLVWHESAGGIDAKAEELGLDPIGDLESRPAFKARVMAAEAMKRIPA